jgi:prolipoprotein diacylglyceryltransferase
MATGLAMFLAAHQGLSLFVVAAILLAAVITFFVLTMARLSVTGEERITYYHHELAVLAVATVLLRLSGKPILPYLDLTILGIGVFLVFGRLGCFRMGCCHGRPHERGIRYREEHADAGFSREYVGVPLFPIQLVESGWALSIVAAGTAMVLTGRPAGTALSLYAVSYGVGRFCFELMRGDPGRLYLWGFSEAQWLSVAILYTVAAAEASSRLPFSSWHAGAAAVLSLAMIVVAVKRASDTNRRHHLLNARHIGELAEGLDRLAQAAVARPAERKPGKLSRIPIARTSLGIQISLGAVRTQEICLSHYTLSRRDESLTLESAQAVARLIRYLARSDGTVKIVEGNHGIFHVLISPA